MHVLVFNPLLNWKMHGETMKMRQEYLWCKLSDFQHSLLRQLLFPMCECWSETWHFLKRIGLYTIKPWYYITVIMSRSWLLLVFRRVLWKIRRFHYLYSVFLNICRDYGMWIMALLWWRNKKERVLFNKNS